MALLTHEQIEELRRIIRDASVSLAISTMGMDVSDEELQRLVDEGYIKASDVGSVVLDSYEFGRLMAQLPGARHMDYGQFRTYLEKNPTELTDRERLAYNEAVDRAGQFCVGLGTRYSGEVGEHVIQVSEELTREFMEGIKTEAGEALSRRDAVGQLRTRLRQMSEDWSRDWDRIASTESQFAHQQGELEATIAEHGKDAMMAKIPEPTACEDCKRLYLGPDGNPIIMPASWWHGQGVSNVGLKRAEWKPVLGAVHPWCQCQLTRVPDKFGFQAETAEDGSVQWDLLPESMLDKSLRKGGPYIGPRGGRWQDPEHTIPWKEDKEAFRAHISKLKQDKATRLKAHRELVKLGGEYKTDRGYVVVLPDASNPGKVRTQSFDEYGFSSHHTYDDMDALTDDTVPYKGKWELATGTLDKMATTEAWAEGTARATVIQALNTLGYHGQRDDVELINGHIDRHGFVSAASALRSWSANGKTLSDESKRLLEKSLEKSRKLHYRTTWNGLPISIENRKGSKRYWYDKPTQRHGETLMHYPYGYIRLTEAADGDHVDVFLGPDEGAKFAFVVHQLRSPDFTEYDEDKVMLGFPSRAEAKRAYLMHFDSPKFLGDMIAIPRDKFIQQCKDGRYRDGSKIEKSKGGKQLGFGWEPIPRGKKGGRRRRKPGGGYEYDYSLEPHTIRGADIEEQRQEAANERVAASPVSNVTMVYLNVSGGTEKKVFAPAGAKEVSGLAGRNLGIQITAHEIPKTRKGMERYARHAKREGLKLMVDSGEFPRFNAQNKADAGKELSPGEKERAALDFDDVMAQYSALADAMPAGTVSVVAPDRIGDGKKTAELRAKYAGQVSGLMERGVEVIVPLQARTAEELLDDYIRVLNAFGRDFIVGIPMAKKPMPMNELLPFLMQVYASGHFPKVHMLGGSEPEKMAGQITQVVATAFWTAKGGISPARIMELVETPQSALRSLQRVVTSEDMQSMKWSGQVKGLMETARKWHGDKGSDQEAMEAYMQAHPERFETLVRDKEEMFRYLAKRLVQFDNTTVNRVVRWGKEHDLTGEQVDATGNLADTPKLERYRETLDKYVESREYQGERFTPDSSSGIDALLWEVIGKSLVGLFKGGTFNAAGLALAGAPNRPPVGTMGNVGKPARTAGEGAWNAEVQDDHPGSKKRRRKNKRKKTGDEPKKRKERMMAAADPRYRDWARPIPDYRQDGKKERDAERNMEWLSNEADRRAERRELRPRLTIHPADLRR